MLQCDLAHCVCVMCVKRQHTSHTDKPRAGVESQTYRTKADVAAPLPFSAGPVPTQRIANKKGVLRISSLERK